MRKFFLLLFPVLVFISCSPEDGSQEATNGIIPLAPTNLSARSNTSSQAELSWTDNSTNESEFKIERKASGQNYAMVGTVNADITIFNDLDLENGKEYTYRVYAFNATGKSLTYTNEASITPKGVPVVGTSAATSIEGTSAIVGGEVISSSGAYISRTGVVWSTNPNPTIDLETKTSHSSGEPQFQSQLINLHPETTYYAKAYAINGMGVGYGEEINFTTGPLPPKNYKITIGGFLNGDQENNPSSPSFQVDYITDSTTENVIYTENLPEIWIEKTRTITARNEVGVEIYITQPDTFLEIYLLEIIDMDSGETIFLTDYFSTLVARNNTDFENSTEKIELRYDILSGEFMFNY